MEGTQRRSWKGVGKEIQVRACLLQDPYLCFTDRGRALAPISREVSGAPSSHRTTCSGLAIQRSCASKPPHCAPGCVCGFLCHTLSGSGLGFFVCRLVDSQRESSEIHVSHGATHGSEESSSFGPPRSSNLKGSSGSFSHFNQS